MQISKMTFYLLAWYHELDLSKLSLHRQISLLLASDPFPLLRGSTRVVWIREITPIDIAVSISLHHLMTADVMDATTATLDA